MIQSHIIISVVICGKMYFLYELGSIEKFSESFKFYIQYSNI